MAAAETHRELEEQIARAGIDYGRRDDMLYRAGWGLQSAGAVLLSIFFMAGAERGLLLYPLGLFEAGVALSAAYLLVWRASVKWMVAVAAAVGLITEALALSGLLSLGGGAEDRLFLVGLGLVLVGAAGLAGKESYCFAWPEGWLLFILYPVAILPLVGGIFEPDGRYAFWASSVIAALQASFLWEKLRQPLLAGCEGGVCGEPPGAGEPGDEQMKWRIESEEQVDPGKNFKQR